MKTLSTLQFTATERCTLESWASTSLVDKATTRRALRAAIVLAAASGRTADAIATEFHVRLSTVYKWHQRFIQERIDGLNDKPRKGAPRRIADEHVADVVRRTLQPTPRHATRWSRRMMSDATGLSRSTIHRIWNRYGIAPDRSTPPNSIVEQR